MKQTIGAVVILAVVCCGPPRAAGVESLKVMTFNVWSGESTAAGRNKLREIMVTSGADVIGVQELDNAAGESIAAAMGFHYHQQSGSDIQVISRYPIVGQSPGNLGVRIQISASQEAWLFNTHLAAYPYQPYDLRDGILPLSEAAVIAAADNARGGQVTSYLNDMAAALDSEIPIFFTGDFNEPSHLDWTAAVADATPRPYDLEVEYPTSKRIVDSGLTDSFRAVRPDPVSDPAYTWTPGYPPPVLDDDEVHDRIDIVYHRGIGVTPMEAITVGFPDSDLSTDLAIPGYNADHRAVVVTFDLPESLLAGDFNLDGVLDAADWLILRTNQLADFAGLSPEEAYARGDLTGDLRNDHADFTKFKQSFEARHGMDSFAAMVAAVPEPSTGLLAALACSVLASRRPPSDRGLSRKSKNQTGCAEKHGDPAGA